MATLNLPHHGIDSSSYVQDHKSHFQSIEGGWAGTRVKGPLAFELVGILAGLLIPLKDAGISVFAVR